MKYIKESITIFFEQKNMVYLFKIYSVAFVLGLASFIFGFVITNRGVVTENNRLWIFSFPSLILFPIGIWVQASSYEAVKRVVGGGVFEFKDTYKTSLKYLWKFFLTSFIVGLIVIGGLILLIIPGVIFSIWYAFALWGTVDKGYGISESLRQSKNLTKGKFWKIVGQISVLVLFTLIVQIGFSFLPKVGTLITTIFGGLFLLPYYLLYRDLQTEGNI
ncbi:MAG: hypothetical protein AAB535_00645 [Patescibacteria group bacterium]